MPAHDHAARRRSIRRGAHERGCWLYVTAKALERAGVDVAGPPPLYRTWAGPRGRLVVHFYAPPTPSE